MSDKMDSGSAPPNEGNQDKSKKYDRQLRLWGDHGQTALESAKVCLINASATGTEILKNLILPGIGSFTIVDGQRVSGEDVGNNFFLDEKSIGQSRAQATTEFLRELNEDVDGDFIEENVDNLLDKNSSFFANFNIVIASNLREKSLLRLAGLLWESDVPLLICRTYGLVGLIRLVIREHTVTESHITSHEDLRLDKPFDGLIKFCDSLNLETMSNKDHSHTPWLVIMYKYLQLWKSQNNGALPITWPERKQLKEMIMAGMRKNEENGNTEENFDEAGRHVITALHHSEVPPEVQRIFDDDACVNLHPESQPFWILARAVKDFVAEEGNGLLPLRGTIPDMTSDSQRYIALQNVYRQQAENDAKVVSTHLQRILESLGRDEPLSMEKMEQQRHSPASSPGKPQDHISDEDVKSFCKNASFLRVIRCKPLASEYDPVPHGGSPPLFASTIAEHMRIEEDDNHRDATLWYVMLRAVDRFEGEFSRYPGADRDSFEPDIGQLKSCVTRLMQEWSLGNTIKDDYVHEMCRFGNSEIHSVASFIGGLAAQEAIKVVTKQFIPINNTFIYNGVKQTSATLQL